MQEWQPEARKNAIGITVHGDEGQGKRGKNVLILSWSSMGVRGKSSHCRFPLTALWTKHVDLSDILIYFQ